jgi:two-component system CheB/CheR fusion protein
LAKKSKKIRPDSRHLGRPLHLDIPTHFPVVGVGASAGGIDAFIQLLEGLPVDSGLAIVFILHMDPSHASVLPQMLSAATRIPVRQAGQGEVVAPNHVYVIPPNANLTLKNGRLFLAERTEGPGRHMPIDLFFSSVADDQKERAVGVILSGTATDGTEGLKAIKAAGGFTMAQDEKSSRFAGMPSSAIASGAVDLVLSPSEMAFELAQLARRPGLFPSGNRDIDRLFAGEESGLEKIFEMLRPATGIDFENYKSSTVRRRIARRMLLHKIERLDAYIRYLTENPSERELLGQDLLINVTGFFRDPDAFKVLEKSVLTTFSKDKAAGTLRVWVPGCSTGEEAYSIAILLLEQFGDYRPIQVFGTDVSVPAIARARLGVYPESAMAAVSADRVKRFFDKESGGGFRVCKKLRDVCLFARQNVAADPPFSKLDLVSCRNVLIYMAPALQQRVIQTFHYALKPKGVLMLSSSESIGPFTELFTLVDKRNRVYRKKMGPSRLPPIPSGRGHLAPGTEALRIEATAASYDPGRETDRLVLAKYSPAGILVNINLDILQFRGETALFLEPEPGAANLNLHNMLRRDLLPGIRAAIRKAAEKNTPVRKPGIQLKIQGKYRVVSIEVVPVPAPSKSKEKFFFVIFEEARGGDIPKVQIHEAPKKSSKSSKENKQVRQLREELMSTKEYLQAAVEEQEATNEELRSALEENQSSNEELQSTNEELETAREELQSANEELTTANEEQLVRNQELAQTNNDQSNLLASMSLPIVMLGPDLRVRRFTPAAEKVLNLIPTDSGRLYSDLRPNLQVENLHGMVAEVLQTLQPRQARVKDLKGRWFSLRIRPYRTVENKIDGVVLLLIDLEESDPTPPQGKP